MRIALDAMGGDFAPQNEVLGAVEAVKRDSSLEVVLVGKKDILLEELKKHGSSSQIKIVHASDVITMSDSPTQSLKEKKDSSLSVAFRLLKEGKVDALVSGGNTGAVLAGSIFSVGRIKNVERPAIIGVFPSLKKPFVILDLGANVDCKPKHLLQFAKMGSIFSKHIFKVQNPKIKLLNIGEEAEKGNELTLEAHKIMKDSPDFNFQGNIEPKYILNGNADVVVCDGFVGNVVLKFGEGAIETIFQLIKEEIKKNLLATIGGIFLLPVFRKLKKKFEYDESGGTILLGVKKIVIIAHGSASSKAIGNAILEAKKIHSKKIIEKIEEAMAKKVGERESNVKK